MKPYIGMIVQYTVERDIGGVKFHNTYPGIVYKLYPDEPGDHVGFTLFFDGQPSRYGKVPRSEKAGDGGWDAIIKG